MTQKKQSPRKHVKKKNNEELVSYAIIAILAVAIVIVLIARISMGNNRSEQPDLPSSTLTPILTPDATPTPEETPTPEITPVATPSVSIIPATPPVSTPVSTPVNTPTVTPSQPSSGVVLSEKTLDDGVVAVMKSYMDTYFDSLVSLQSKDITHLFAG